MDVDLPLVSLTVVIDITTLLVPGEPIRCEPGSFQNTTGRDYCFDCPAGYHCTDGENTLQCPRGHYCPTNTTAAIPKCPTGTYNEFLGLKALLDLFISN